MGEGQGGGCFLRCLPNDLNNAIQITHDVLVGESQYSESLRPEPSITSCVSLLANHEIVRLSIELDDEPSRMTDEIGHVLA